MDRIKLRFRDADRDVLYAAVVWPLMDPDHQFRVKTSFPEVAASEWVRANSLQQYADEVARRVRRPLRIEFEVEGGEIVGRMLWPRSPEVAKAGGPVQAMDSRYGGTERVGPTLDDVANEFAEGGE